MKNYNYKSNLEKIEAIEHSFDVNTLEYRGIRLWPMIRLMIDLQLTFPKNNHTRKVTPINGRIPVIDSKKEIEKILQKNQNTDIIFFSRPGEHVEKSKDKFYNPYVDPLIDIIRHKYKFLKLEHYTNQSKETLPRTEKTHFIHPVIIDYKMDTITHFEHFLYFQDKVKHYANITIDEEMVLEIARNIFAMHIFYKDLLSQIQPDVVFNVCFAHFVAMSLFSACKKLNISSVDFQHGMHGDNHSLYSHWTVLPKDGHDLLPDFFWCWGQSSLDGIEKWHDPECPNHRAIVGGNPRMKNWFDKDDSLIEESKSQFYDRLENTNSVILVTLQRIYKSHKILPDHFFEAMRQAPDEWLWLIRLSPAANSKEDKSEIDALMKKNNVRNYEIDNATSSPLYSLLKRCHHHITDSSSSSYEALFFKVPTTLIGPNGLENLSSEINKGVFAYANTSQSLLQSINKGFINPKIDPSEFIQTSRECAENALKIIMNHPRQYQVQNQYKYVMHYAHAMNKLGADVANNGYIEAALNIFQKAIEASPNFYKIYNNIAVLYCHKNENDKALVNFFRALDISKNDTRLIKNVIEFLKILGNLESSGKMLLLF